MAGHATLVEGSGERKAKTRVGPGERDSRQAEEAGTGGGEQQEAIGQRKAADVFSSIGLPVEHSAVVEAKLWKDDV